MKKTTKGAIAAGAAAVLLAGGAGTFAAWQDSATSGANGTITAGHLTIDEDGTGAWKWVGGANDGQDFEPGRDFIVPGDVVAYTSNYDYSVKGTNLQAKAEVDFGTANSGDLVGVVNVDTTTSSGVDLNNLTDGDSGNIPISVTVTFPANNGVYDQAGMDKSLTLADASVKITQTAPAN